MYFFFYLFFQYSTKPAHKEYQSQEQPWISVPDHPKNQFRITNPELLSPPEAVLQERFNIKNDINTNSSIKKKNSEPEWKPVELDYSKLHKHFLMLSKIRLTCK